YRSPKALAEAGESVDALHRPDGCPAATLSARPGNEVSRAPFCENNPRSSRRCQCRQAALAVRIAELRSVPPRSLPFTTLSGRWGKCTEVVHKALQILS